MQSAARVADQALVGLTRQHRQALAAFMVLVVCGLGWHEREQRLHTQTLASLAASQIAGRPVSVRCPGVLKRTFLQEINHGTVKFVDGRPVDETHLSGEACGGLRRLVAEGDRLDLRCLQLDACPADDTQVALGVAVLAHEAVHLRGVADEAATECESVRRAAGVARILGATAPAAAYIADWKFSVGADHLPDQYQNSGDCRVEPGR